MLLKLTTVLFLISFAFYIWLQNETECSYYLKTGQCKFGSTCKFHHPQPSNMMVSLRGSPVYPSVHSPTTPGQQSYPGGITNWPLSRASFIPSPRWQSPSSYSPLILPQGVLSVPGWNAYSVSFSFLVFRNAVMIMRLLVYIRGNRLPFVRSLGLGISFDT